MYFLYIIFFGILLKAMAGNDAIDNIIFFFV